MTVTRQYIGTKTLYYIYYIYHPVCHRLKGRILCNADDICIVYDNKTLNLAMSDAKSILKGVDV